MKLLALPLEDDQANARSICNEKSWTVQEQNWLHTYADYVAKRGCGKLISRARITPNIDRDLYNLYDSAKGKSISEKIRFGEAVGSCPMCGSGHTGTVDHFLPRETYPEFSIFSPNLIPACAACNMFTKGTRFVGPGSHDHLIHPYFDADADVRLWEVVFVRPLAAVTFTTQPLKQLSPVLQQRVRFQLGVVLGRSFEASMRHLWPAHIESIAEEAARKRKTTITDRFVITETARQARYASRRGNHNSWLAAFHWSLIDDADAVEFVSGEARKLLHLHTTKPGMDQAQRSW